MDKNDPYSTFFDLEASGIEHVLSDMPFITNACSLRIKVNFIVVGIWGQHISCLFWQLLRVNLIWHILVQIRLSFTK